ncbi:MULTISPECIES: NAD-dependent epimerase/dehydratase family protein [Roseomonadaceae]|uniref:NAD-dependent epimerase/dehydratase family protein n=1 Tax=Falsiroseomonas oleicola TaxID=2801474 RepID=A0ABS6HC29_9PROT|nr:NAD-dependent epimerase/dehydratase family protein [Roseomonas oleicola]MBU8546287.1 NAD-dependent epimerase/dehydratase family protein [Roseomonas oleicola]
MTILVTGVAGFVGSHVAAALLARGERVVGVDNVNSYYSVALKEARLARLRLSPDFHFLRLDLADREAFFAALAPEFDGITEVIHLAAQAGVRYSMVDPYAYVASNVMGHVVMLEAARRMPKLRHLVYASSSSVYGGNTRLPFRETDAVELPVSLYAATKRADELIGQAYSHLYGLPQTGLRFFTVYGPWGRPDMAYYSFAKAIAAGEPITLYEGGELKRDFTYVDDIVQGVIGCLPHPPGAGDRARLLNIGNHRSERVMTLVRLLEEGLGRRATIIDAPRPVADVEETFADISAIQALCGFAPTTPLSVGIPKFVTWFREWNGV